MGSRVVLLAIVLTSCRGWLGLEDRRPDAAPSDSACPTYFEDRDHDGHGDPERPVTSCIRPTGVSELADDCRDDDRYAWSGRHEDCDGLDNDCNGAADDVCNANCIALPPRTTSSGPVSYMRCLALLTWDDAEASCAALGFHLAWIEDDVENAYFNDKIFLDTWIGGNDIVLANRWLWGTGVQITSFHWAPYEPSGGGCLTMNRDQWKDLPCTNTRPYLCER